MFLRIFLNRIVWLCYIHYFAQNLPEYLKFFKNSKLQILALVHIFKDYISQLFPKHSPISQIQYTRLHFENYPSFSFLSSVNLLNLFPMPRIFSTLLVWWICVFFSKTSLQINLFHLPVLNSSVQWLSPSLQLVWFFEAYITYFPSSWPTLLRCRWLLIILLKIFVSLWVIHSMCSVSMCWMEPYHRAKNNSKTWIG